MQNTKLIQLLKTFSQAEFSDFGRYLNSPYNNESAKITRFYNCLRKYYPEFENRKFSREFIYRNIYGDAEFDDKKLRDRFSDMLRLAEEFLAFQRLKRSKIEFKRLVLNEYADRGLEKHFDKTHKEIQTVIDSSGIIDSDHFLNIYCNERDRSDFYENRKLLGKRNSQYEEFANELDLFLNYFVCHILYYYTLMYNWQGNLKYEFDFKFCKPVMQYIDENKLYYNPLIKALYLIMKIRDDEENDELFFELKDVYFKSLELFEEDDKLRIGTILFNDAQRRAFREKPGFENERFEIMDFQLKHELYPHENGGISREQYFNYVLLSLDIGKTEWAENFIENYTHKLPPVRREDAFLYVNGYLMFTKRNYEGALKELAGIKGGDYIYYIRIKALQAMIYFELKDPEKVLTLIDSFKHYLSSNSVVPEGLKKRYTNFTNMINKLTYLFLKPDVISAELLENEIKGFPVNEVTSHKKWLLEKISVIKLNEKL